MRKIVTFLINVIKAIFSFKRSKKNSKKDVSDLPDDRYPIW